MSNYSNNKKLIADYIRGEDINIDIDILENDIDFMIAVIDYSNDKNIFKLCGEDVKYNFEMIKFLVEKFHMDYEFIISTVLDFLDNYDHTYWYKKYTEEFLDNDKINIEELEVLITIDKYLPERLDERIIEIKVRLKNEFIKFRGTLETIIRSFPEEKLAYQLGKGFELIEMNFPTSYLIKDYYANEIVAEIIRESQGNNFEEKVHNSYGNIEVPESAIKVLVAIVNQHDIELSNYIIARQKAFFKYLNEIDYVIKRWEKFNNTKLDEKIMTILDEINNYYFEHGHLLDIDELEAIRYFAKLLNLEERFKKLEPILFECDSYMVSPNRDNYYSKKMIKDLTQIIKNIMEDKNQTTDYEVGTEDPDNHNHICPFRLKK